MATVVKEVREEILEKKPKVDLYGIAGIFDDPDARSKIAFGGYIKVLDGEFHGELIDTYGPSEIRGVLKGDTIAFQKEYTLKQHLSDIEYNLKRTDNGHFRGNCLISNLILRVEIEAELSIFLLNEDAHFVVAGPPLPKDMVKRFYGIR